MASCHSFDWIPSTSSTSRSLLLVPTVPLVVRLLFAVSINGAIDSFPASAGISSPSGHPSSSADPSHSSTRLAEQLTRDPTPFLSASSTIFPSNSAENPSPPSYSQFTISSVASDQLTAATSGCLPGSERCVIWFEGWPFFTHSFSQLFMHQLIQLEPQQELIFSGISINNTDVCAGRAGGDNQLVKLDLDSESVEVELQTVDQAQDVYLESQTQIGNLKSVEPCTFQLANSSSMSPASSTSSIPVTLYLRELPRPVFSNWKRSRHHIDSDANEKLTKFKNLENKDIEQEGEMWDGQHRNLVKPEQAELPHIIYRASFPLDLRPFSSSSSLSPACSVSIFVFMVAENLDTNLMSILSQETDQLIRSDPHRVEWMKSNTSSVFSPTDFATARSRIHSHLGLPSSSSLSHLHPAVYYSFLSNPCLRIITPSYHSRSCLIPRGVPENRINVLPHGVDLEKYGKKQRNEAEITKLRRRWDREQNGREVVLLHVSGFAPIKGVRYLLTGFWHLLYRLHVQTLFSSSSSSHSHFYPLLVLKGNDSVYPSSKIFPLLLVKSQRVFIRQIKLIWLLHQRTASGLITKTEQKEMKQRIEIMEIERLRRRFDKEKICEIDLDGLCKEEVELKCGYGNCNQQQHMEQQQLNQSEIESKMFESEEEYDSVVFDEDTDRFFASHNRSSSSPSGLPSSATSFVSLSASEFSSWHSHRVWLLSLFRHWIEVERRLDFLALPLSNSALRSLIAAADIYVCSSLAEGFALPVLESMAAGLQLITPAGGVTDEYIYRWNSTKKNDGTGTIEHGEQDERQNDREPLSCQIQTFVDEEMHVTTPKEESIADCMDKTGRDDNERREMKLQGPQSVADQQLEWSHVSKKLLHTMIEQHQQNQIRNLH